MKPLKLLSNIFKRANVVNEEHLAMINTIEKTLSQIKDDTDLIKLEMLISSATGDWLNTWGDWFGVKRLIEEPDELYRKRILAVITKPKNTVPALIATARAYIGDENANVQVYEPHNDLRKFNVSKWGSQDRYQDGEYYSVGVADIHIPVPVTPVLRRTVDQAKAAGIRVYYTMLGELGNGQIFDMSAKNPPKSGNTVEIQPLLLDPAYGHIFDVARGMRSGSQTVFFEGAEILRDLSPALYWRISDSSWHKVWQVAHLSVDEITKMEDIPDMPSFPWDAFQEEFISLKKAARSSTLWRSEAIGGRSGYKLDPYDLKNPLPFVEPELIFVPQRFLKMSEGENLSQREIVVEPRFDKLLDGLLSGGRNSWDYRLTETNIWLPYHKPYEIRFTGEKTLNDLASKTIDEFYALNNNSATPDNKGAYKEHFSYKKSTRSFSKRRSEFTGGRSGYFLDPIDKLKPIPFVDESPWFSVKEAIKEETKTSIGSGSYVEKDLKLVKPKTELMSGHRTSWNEDGKETTLTRATRTIMASAEIKLDDIKSSLLYHLTNMIDKTSIKPVRANNDVTANSPMSSKGFQSLNDVADVPLFELYDKGEYSTLPMVDKSEVAREFTNLSPPTMSWNTKRSDVAGGLSGYRLTTSDDDNLLEFKYKKIVVSEDILIEHHEGVKISSDDFKETQIKVDRKVLDDSIHSGHQELFIGVREKEIELGEEVRRNDVTSTVKLEEIWSWELNLVEDGVFISDRDNFRELCSAKRVNASSELNLNAVMNELVFSLDFKKDFDTTPTEQELVSYDYASRSGKAFRSGKAGTLDTLAGARSGYKLTSSDLKSPIEFVDKGTIFDKTAVVEAPQTSEMDIRHYKESELEAVYHGGGVSGDLNIKDTEIGEDAKVYSAFSSATLESIYYDMIDVVTTRRDSTSSHEEAVSFYKVVTSSSILGWKGFENLEAIYDLSVYELNSLPDLYQDSIHREVVAI